MPRMYMKDLLAQMKVEEDKKQRDLDVKQLDRFKAILSTIETQKAGLSQAVMDVHSKKAAFKYGDLLSLADAISPGQYLPAEVNVQATNAPEKNTPDQVMGMFKAGVIDARQALTMLGLSSVLRDDHNTPPQEKEPEVVMKRDPKFDVF